MKIDVRKTINNLDGEPIQDTEGTILTFKNMAIKALMQDHRSDSVDPAEKLKSFDVANRINKAEDFVDLKVDEAALIKERANLLLGRFVFVRISQLLEGEDTDEKNTT